MIERRSLFLALAALVAAGPALAQFPPAQPDGGAGGASSSGGAMGGGMSADDENAQGVEAGRDGPMRQSGANRRQGLQNTDVQPSPRPTSPPQGSRRPRRRRRQTPTRRQRRQQR